MVRFGLTAVIGHIPSGTPTGSKGLNGGYAQKADTAKLQSLGAHRDVQALAAKLDQLAKLGDDDVIKQVTSGMSDHVDVSLGPVLPHLH